MITAWVAPQYNVRLDRVKQTTTKELVDAAVRDKNAGRSNLRAEYVTAEPNVLSRHQCEREASIIKFFFDHDKVVPEEPSQEYLARVKRELVEHVHGILKEGAGVSEEQPYTIHCANRHGPKEGGQGFKISYRFFVSGLRTDMFSIKSAIRIYAKKRYGTPKTADFDTVIYGQNRRMCMILGVKSNTDKRILQPEVEQGRELSLYDYIIQHVDPGNWPLVKVDANAEYTMDFSSNSQRRIAFSSEGEQGQEGDGDEALEDDMEEGSGEGEERASKRGKLFECDNGTPFGTLKNALRRAGFTNAAQAGPERTSSDKVMHIPFDCDKRHDCPICHLDHENNRWSVSISKEGGIGVCNLSERCFKVGLVSQHFLHPFVAGLVDDDNSHRVFAEAYIKSREGTLLYNEGTCKFHMFKNQKWEEVPDELIMEDVSAYLRRHLLKPELEKIDEWKSVMRQLKVTGEKIQVRATYYKKEVKKAYNNMGSASFLFNVAKMAKGMVYAPASQFNRNHDLLHFTNGVLDLDTRELRDTVPEDYNTYTTGYEYHAEAEPEAVEVHRRFMEKVYPNPGVREVAQRTMGSTLTGHNHGKKIFIFTDDGGELGGNNGKTKVFGLHLKTLGDYAVVAKKDFMYDSPSNGESASPFLCKLEGKRAVLVEEPEPNKKLAEGMIKELTNGTNAVLPVRDLYKTGRSMEVCCKIMVAFNNGKSPRFDPYDEALTKRFLPVPHVAHFTSDRRKWDPIRNVHPMDTGIGEKLNQECKLAHLLWCLEGYDNFKASGLELDSMPAVIGDFKRVLVFKNTPVYAYLGEVLEETGDLQRDVLDMAVAWDMYKKDKRSIRWLTLEQFEASFKVFVNGRVPNAFQHVKTSSGAQGKTVVARGFKIKPPPVFGTNGFGGVGGFTSSYGNENMNGDVFM